MEIDPRWTMAREVTAATPADITLDGTLDAADRIAVALFDGNAMPTERRIDGAYDPLYDLDADRHIDQDDLHLVTEALAP